MRFRSMILFSVVALFACSVSANDKKKPTLPATVLNARTVAVVIDPEAGVSPGCSACESNCRRRCGESAGKMGAIQARDERYERRHCHRDSQGQRKTCAANDSRKNSIKRPA